MFAAARTRENSYPSPALKLATGSVDAVVERSTLKHAAFAANVATWDHPSVAARKRAGPTRRPRHADRRRNDARTHTRRGTAAVRQLASVAWATRFASFPGASDYALSRPGATGQARLTTRRTLARAARLHDPSGRVTHILGHDTRALPRSVIASRGQPAFATGAARISRAADARLRRHDALR